MHYQSALFSTPSCDHADAPLLAILESCSCHEHETGAEDASELAPGGEILAPALVSPWPEVKPAQVRAVSAPLRLESW